MKKEVTVLLATHNSENFIAVQLSSILAQTYKNWKVLVHDDNSSDNTLEILRKFAKIDDRIVILDDKIPCGNAQSNFWHLMKNAPKSDYYMFCDHDDLWLRDKISICVNEAEKFESNVPVLVHTDLKVVDKDLKVISESMFQSQNMLKEQTLAQTLIQNNVTGCTMLINDELLKIALNKRDCSNVVMHDWFLNIIASAIGNVKFVDKPTILYRQHGNNEVGAKNARSVKFVIEKLKNDNRENLKKSFMQAAEVSFLLGEKHKNEEIDAYASILSKGKFEKIVICKKYGFWKNSLLKKIGQILFV